MKHTLLILAAGCALLSSLVFAAKTEKIDIYHKGRLINISLSALPAHLKHGDYYSLECTDSVNLQLNAVNGTVCTDATDLAGAMALVNSIRDEFSHYQLFNDAGIPTHLCVITPDSLATLNYFENAQQGSYGWNFTFSQVSCLPVLPPS